jgi:CMP-N,N'-diacetyllegionaminic acid synthase
VTPWGEARVLGLIPARGGSSRLQRKNLAVLQGKTLVRRALDTALAAGCFDTVALSSDDPAILAEADPLSEVVQITRPPELATGDARTYDAVVHALGALERAPGTPRFDTVAVIQCSSPFTAPQDLAGAVELGLRTGAGSVASVVRVAGMAHPLKLKRLIGDRLVPFIEDDRFTPSHELPELWVRNGSIYVARRDTIEGGSLDSDDIRGFPMPPERSHDIDTPLDLAFADFLLQRGTV